MDNVSRATRSRMMASIGPRDTAPEHAVRRCLHAQGMRFRLHVKHLPGRPDIVLAKYRAAVFVHGCFWHRHQGCSNAVLPASNRRFWIQKLGANRRRDAAAIARLRASGWRVAVVWECVVRNSDPAIALQPLVRWIRSNRPAMELPGPRAAKRSRRS
jgi:DNA mismatch endonuclease, patch repair protein